MKKYRVNPNEKVKLSKHDPSDDSEFDTDKKGSDELLDEMRIRIAELQTLLYAEQKHKLLIVIQAMDTGGKDGTVRHVFKGVDQQGVNVASFKKPTEEELAHDYLWRVHKRTPAKGKIVIFNRSHYEDIIAVRVKKIAPKSVWSKRDEHIVNFEKTLVEEGTTIIKLFLNISKDEQKERLQARLDQAHKHWKFNPADLEDRKRWDEFQEAYEDVLSKTSTKEAPWYVIPANRKWYRNLVVAQLIIDTLEGLKMQYPEPDFDPKAIEID